MKIGKTIKLFRIQRGLNQAELAERAHISKSYISLVEKGTREPSLSNLEKLAEALNIPVSMIVFMSSDNSELQNISPELADKLKLLSMDLISSNG